MDPWSVGRARAAFWAVGAVFAAALAYVVYRFVGTFVFGLFIYYATRPVYRRVRRRVHRPSVAAAGALFLLALPALLLLAYAIAIGINELTRVVNGTGLGPLEALVEPYVDVSAVVRDPGQLLANGGLDVVMSSLSSASAFLGFFGLMALHLFLMLAIAFYLLRDGHRLSRWFRTRFGDERGVLEEYVRAVDRDLHSVFFGNILNAAITGTIGAISYSVLDFLAPAGLTVPYAALLGLLTGVASLVPVVGMKLVYVPLTGYLFGRVFIADLSGVLWFPVVFALVSLVIVDTIPDLVLRPYVSGRNLHVGMVMVAYVLGPLLFGWYGIFLGPLVLVLFVHFARIVVPELITGRPIEPYAVDPGNMTAVPDDGTDAAEGAVVEDAEETDRAD